jgi:hypothetical protein
MIDYDVCERAKWISSAKQICLWFRNNPMARAGQCRKLCDLTLTIFRSGGVKRKPRPTSSIGERTRSLETLSTENIGIALQKNILI